jgi:hypothetical protein
MAKRLHKPKPAENEITLTAFIEKNHKLITVLGVFTALTVFSDSIKNETFGTVLSILFLSMTVTLWLELWSTFPSQEVGWLLIIFENLLSLSVLIIVIYWLFNINIVYSEGIFGITFLISMGLISGLVKKYNVFNVLFRARVGEKKNIRYVFGLALIALIILFSIVISNVASPYITNWLDTANTAD